MALKHASLDRTTLPGEGRGWNCGPWNYANKYSRFWETMFNIDLKILSNISSGLKQLCQEWEDGPDGVCKSVEHEQSNSLKLKIISCFVLYFLMILIPKIPTLPTILTPW